MKKVMEKDLENIQGGFSVSVALAVSAAVIFISGIIEGIVHPRKCSE